MQANDAVKAPPTASLGSEPERFSETNVQTAGIDEPDIVKTDGKEIYFSSSRSEFMPLRMSSEPSDSSMSPSARDEGGVKAIKAFPLENMSVDSRMDKSGELLLSGNVLIVIPSQKNYWARNESKIYGYDVSDPKNPKELWDIELKESASIAGARLKWRKALSGDQDGHF